MKRKKTHNNIQTGDTVMLKECDWYGKGKVTHIDSFNENGEWHEIVTVDFPTLESNFKTDMRNLKKV